MRGKWSIGAAAAAILTASMASAAWAQTEDAPGDDSTRQQLRVDASVSAEIADSEDKDWYRVSVRTGQMYIFTLIGDESADSGLGDPMLVIYDQDGDEITSNDDDGDSLNSRIRFVPTRRGTIFVEAGGFAGSSGAYVLSASADRAPADDVGNAADTRAVITPGQTVTGVLDYAGDTDWWSIALEAGESYRFSLNSAESEGESLGDPYLRLRNAEGEEIVGDDDGGGDLNSYLEFTAIESGNHFLEARGFGDNAEGAYELIARDGDIPSNVNTDVSLSASGDYRMGTLAPGGDTDWYRLELGEGESVRVALNAALTNGLDDPLLIMYDSEGAEVARNDDAGGSLNSQIEFTAAAEDAYFVEARGFFEEAQGDYEIYVTAGEIGDSAYNADVLGIDAEVSSMIGVEGDVDWFRLDMVEGRPYRIRLVQADPESSFDPYLTLYDSEGEILAVDDDGGAGLNAYLGYTSVTGGSYFVGVSSYENQGTGGYSLYASDTDVPGSANTDEYLSGDDAEDRLSSIDIPGDVDTYQTELSAGQRYAITVNGAGANPLADPHLTIVGADEVQLSVDDDSGPGLNASLVFAPTSTATYYVEVRGRRNLTGQYQVRVEPEE